KFKNFRERLEEGEIVDAFEHEEADGTVGGADEQNRVYPGGMIRGQERSAAGRNIFLALQIEAVDGVRGNPEEQAEQGIRQEPEDVREGRKRTHGCPEKESQRAVVEEGVGDVIDKGRRKNADKREKIRSRKNASTLLLLGTMLQ